MTLIDGVNKCLRAIGEIKVPDGVDLDTLDPLHEAVQIRDIIIEQNKELQTSGWWFNVENWTFLPDALTNKIGVPVTVLALRGVSTNVILQGNNLYDVDNQSLEFDDGVECITTFERDFEDTPESFAQYVIATSAEEAQFTFKGDDTADRKLEKAVNKAFLKVERENMRNKNINLISTGRLTDRGANPTPL